MRRIIFIIPKIGIGGSEGSLIKLANCLEKHTNWQIEIIVYKAYHSNYFHFLNPKIKIHIFHSSSSLNPILWLYIWKKIISIKPHFVVGWSTYANLLTLIVSIFPHNWKTIISERNYLPEVFSKNNCSKLRRSIIFFFIKLLYRKSNIITANSKRSLRFLELFIGRGPVYQQLFNFINVEFALKCSRQSLTEIPNFSEQPHILAIGRIVNQKGFDILLKALKIVRNQKPWSILIVGDGPEKDGLKRLSKRLHLSNAIYWLGEQSNPFPFYGWADLVVVPSRYEGFPNVILEAMACKRAVICSDCMTGPKEMTDNGNAAVLFPVEDSLVLADRILFLGKNKTHRDFLGDKARDHIKKNFDKEIVFPKILSLFSDT